MNDETIRPAAPEPAPAETVPGGGVALETATVASLKEQFNLDPVEVRYLGPLLKYLIGDYAKGVREVVINRPGEIAFEYADGTWKFLEAPELTETQLMDATRMFANRAGDVFGPGRPMLGCKIFGGHRLQVVAGENTASRFTMAIRYNRKIQFTLDDYQFDKGEREKIIEAVQNRKTILISGGTSTGKTSFMNALLPHVPLEERLVTLEDVPELSLPHKNWVSFLFNNKKPELILELMNATLRMRPDRILMGEIRKENAFTFCSAINTGHEGSMATIHANSPKSALDAVINRVLLNGDSVESAIQALHRQLVEDVYGVVQLNRVKDGIKGYFEVLKK